MSTISQCPLCSRMVRIPEHLDASALVRCPLCGGEYPLIEMLELLPPELIPVPTLQKAILADSIQADKAKILSEPAGDAAAIDAPPVATPFVLHYDPVEQGQYTAETAEHPLDDEVINLIARHKDSTEKKYTLSESAVAATMGPGKPKNVLRIAIAYLVGGLAGIAIAYVALAWIMGSRFDLPRPPKALKPVLQYVLPERIWAEKDQPRK